MIAAPAYVRYEDFLEAERHSETKHEWLDGVVYAMAGGSIEHSRLANRIANALTNALHGCEVHQSDAMTFVRATQLSTYAGVAIVCGPVEIQKIERDGRVLGEALVNPTILVEVLSESTEEYDRGEKFSHYIQIPSLREYVLVSQDTPRIEVFRRRERGHWVHDEARARQSISIGERAILVDEVYRRVTG